MDEVLRQYYETGSLPNDVDKASLCDHLLSLAFPSMGDENKRDVLDLGFVMLKNISPIPIGSYGCDYSIVEAARVSVGKGLDNVGGDKRLTKFLWDHKHMSPFEHTIISVIVKCPIPIARHFMRHRTFSYNEESARYKKPEGEFYTPAYLRMQDQKNKQCSTDTIVPESFDLIKEMENIYKDAWRLYEKMLEKGCSRE
jgi:thymidylate synthase (FAD)